MMVELQRELAAAQQSLLSLEFASAGDLVAKVADDLRIRCSVPPGMFDQSIETLVGQPHSAIRRLWTSILRGSSVPEQAIPHHVLNLAQQTQLVEAFADPERALNGVRGKIRDVVGGFPRVASDIEVGKNPGDVLDPYILAATQYLMCGGDFREAIEHTVAHKALMMIEGLLGHLHEDIVGVMRGNVRAPDTGTVARMKAIPCDGGSWLDLRNHTVADLLGNMRGR